MSARANLSVFVATAPGLEPLAQAELRALGHARLQPEPGGVSFRGTLGDVYAANLHLRTATRVLVRLGEFHAEAFYELERKAKRLPWDVVLARGREVRIRVTCRKSRLYHSDAVAERVASVVARHTDAAAARDLDEHDTDAGDDPGAQLVVVRLFHDRCTVSIDSSGALLHKRGYRQALAKAPLRETLAAAALVAGGWTGAGPLLDPMCGSGTIAIEGALIARRIAPGLRRIFAFERWPGFDRAEWEATIAAARSVELATSPVPIRASDRDAGAVAAARANAERAGVERDVEISQRALSAIEPPAGDGWLVTNPPYGVRIGERDRLRNLYAQLGHVVRAKCSGWTVVLVSADRALERETRLPLRDVLRTTNGGVAVRIVTAK